MKIELLNKDYVKQQYFIAVNSARTCYDSKSDSSNGVIGDKDRKLMQNLMKAGHHTIFEHIDIVVHIDGMSRALLQQWSRHRLQSQNVKSTRYTIDKMLKEFKEQYQALGYIEKELIDEYFVDFPYANQIIEEIMFLICKDEWEFNKANNDVLKYCFPEALKTETISKLNLRSFINMYKLRIDKHAIKEFQICVKSIYNILPDYIQELIDIEVNK